MYFGLNIMRYGCRCSILCRYLSTAEISTALRPFYFSVHPDLFGKFPEQRSVNEASLQQLSALLEAQRKNLKMSVAPLVFYLRQKDMPLGQFKYIKVQLNGNSARDTVKIILNACELPTKYVDKIATIESSKIMPSRPKERNSAFDEFEEILMKRKKAKKVNLPNNVIDWILNNSSLGREKYEMVNPTREQVKTLSTFLQDNYHIKEVKWDRGWNISHIRGALQSLVSLAAQHEQYMSNLKGRTLALGQFTGVSLDGEIFLSIIDVRSEWLNLIKRVDQQDSALQRIPDYEKTLSNILKDIHICRRKFMPKVSATQYCSHLRQLTTSIGDFYGSGKKFSDNVPESLKKYELVVEPEAGPLMVSPTGQFITPSSCPADELMPYISDHLDEAMLLLTEYSINKHVERALHEEVKSRFSLLELHKDDSITPALMIMCCQRLLTRQDQLHSKLEGNILFITHYYSVLSEGVLCIPWNFN